MENLNLDQLYSNMIQACHEGRDYEKYKKLFDKKILNERPFDTELYQTLEIITSKYIDRSTRVLDYGCGGGKLLFFLYSLDYKNIKGCDIVTNYGELKDVQIDKNNFIFNKIFNVNNAFSSCKQFNKNDENLTVYKDKSFDLIVSEQVLEHCHNLDGYTDECLRLLDENGSAYLTFGQRLGPVENHINTWLIHWFPKFIMNYWLDIFRKERGGSKYYDKLLNLKTVFYFKKLFNSKFKNVDWLTPRYLGETNIKFYKRRKKMRQIFN
ncbi:methyltransferase domain-containing protein, partial [Elusimicrobiota bacterium]